jgi:hypothetical protein
MSGPQYPVMRPQDLRLAIDLMELGYRRASVIRWLQTRRGALMSVRRDLMKQAIPPLRRR